MRHRAYIRKHSGLDKWVAVIAEVDGPYRTFRLALADSKVEQAIEHGERYARLFDELRGIFPDGDGTATIPALPWHCLWCGQLLPNDAAAGQLTCGRKQHRNGYLASYRRRTYRPELCEHPEKRKFVHRGTAMYVARQLNPNDGDCYECACGTFHLTRSEGIFAAIEQCRKPPKRQRQGT